MINWFFTHFQIFIEQIGLVKIFEMVIAKRASTPINVYWLWIRLFNIVKAGVFAIHLILAIHLVASDIWFSECVREPQRVWESLSEFEREPQRVWESVYWPHGERKKENETMAPVNFEWIGCHYTNMQLSIAHSCLTSSRFVVIFVSILSLQSLRLSFTRSICKWLNQIICDY